MCQVQSCHFLCVSHHSLVNNVRGSHYCYLSKRWEKRLKISYHMAGRELELRKPNPECLLLMTMLFCLILYQYLLPFQVLMHGSCSTAYFSNIFQKLLSTLQFPGNSIRIHVCWSQWPLFFRLVLFLKHF